MSPQNSTPLTVEDPRFTAYLLNELDPADAALVASEIQARPDLQQAAVELQELVGCLTAEFASEPFDDAVELEPAASPLAVQAVDPRPRRHWLLRRPVWLATALSLGTVAAFLQLQWPAAFRPGGSLDRLAQAKPHASATPEILSEVGYPGNETRFRSSRRWEAEEALEMTEEREDLNFSMASGGGKKDYETAQAQGGPRPDDLDLSDSGPDALRTTAPVPPNGSGRVFSGESDLGAGDLPPDEPKSTLSTVQRKPRKTQELTKEAARVIAGTSSAPSPSTPVVTKSPGPQATPPAEEPAPASTPAAAPGGYASRSSGMKRKEGDDLVESRAIVGRVVDDRRFSALNGGNVSGAPAPRDFAESETEYRVEAPLGPGNETYTRIIERGFVSPVAEPLSTFSVDVDTAGYSNLRRLLVDNRRLPPPEAVRIEEMLNYFHYDYAPPAAEDEAPFAAHVEVGACPWEPQHRLIRIGLKGREIAKEARPASNLVFLVDVSGSMSDANKLPLVRSSMTMLARELDQRDRIALVTYSDTAKLVLDSIGMQQRDTVIDTVNGLTAAGSTNGAGGIQLAYETAARHFIKGGTNRVILCTDGDFNVGISQDDQLVEFIQEKAKSGVFLSVFGFGMGNLKDSKLEKLADKGNGHYGYIDSPREAQKAFIDDLSGTLVTIAKDVKLQVEFNPAQVSHYRLIGYENRALPNQDFDDDRKDAGEIGAGHAVTALYEFIPAGAAPPRRGAGLKYQNPPPAAPAVGEGPGVNPELLTIKLRYKRPDADESKLSEFAVTDRREARQPSTDFQFAAAVAAFGLVLRDSKYKGQASLALAQELASGARGPDKDARRAEFLELLNQTRRLAPQR